MPIVAVGEDQPRLAGGDTILDRLWAEGRKQRLINGTGAPRSENDDEQFGNAWETGRHPIARPDAASVQQVGEASERSFSSTKVDQCAATVLAFPEEGDAARLGMPIAALNAGVEPLLETAGEFGFDLGRGELGGEVISARYRCRCAGACIRHRRFLLPLLVVGTRPAKKTAEGSPAR